MPIRILLAVVVVAAGCDKAGKPVATETGAATKIVATTNIVADTVRRLGGDDVQVTALMGAGVDPHLYKASEGDVSRMAAADIVVYNGLHLEGKMVEIFARMAENGKPTVAITAGIPAGQLLAFPDYPGNNDPHIWFDVSLWSQGVAYLAERLSELDPAHADGYRARAADFISELGTLDQWVRQQVELIPEPVRVLVTAHDAFGYFGRAYGMEVRGLLGISTASEAGAADVQDLAAFIADREIPAVFVETTVPERYVEALRQAVKSKGGDVKVGGSLFSDALGEPGGPGGTYVEMVRHNVSTISGALKGHQGP